MGAARLSRASRTGDAGDRGFLRDVTVSRATRYHYAHWRRPADRRGLISVAGYEQCLEIVKDALAGFVPPGKSIDKNLDLVGDLGLSSLQVLEIVTDIEDSLDISLPLNELPAVSTVEQLARLLESASGGEAA